MARRPRIELIEDDAGVRIDVTSPRRVDVVLREVLEGFAYRVPQYEAGVLELVDAFVRGEEGSRERMHPDALFQIGVSGAQRDVWDLVDVRASVPGDSTGAVFAHRYLDLAPRAEEARLSPRSPSRRPVGCAG